MPTWWSPLQPLRKARPISTYREIVPLWAQDSFPKGSHVWEPKLSKCASVSRDRRSPDVSWIFEHLSFLPCPELCTWPGWGTVPSLTQAVGAVPHGHCPACCPAAAPSAAQPGALQHLPAMGSHLPHPGSEPGAAAGVGWGQGALPALMASSFPTVLALCSRSWGCAGEWISLQTQSVIVVTRLAFFFFMQNGSFQAFSSWFLWFLFWARVPISSCTSRSWTQQSHHLIPENCWFNVAA